MSPQPLALGDIAEAIEGESYTSTKKAVLDFMKEFNSRDSALEVVQVQDTFQMRVKPEYHSVASQFASQGIFHKGIMKTLALIAFKQPITQSAVIKYRNNKAYDHVAKLMGEGFITREPRGRTFVLRTTKKFLEHFGDKGLKEKKESAQ